MLTNNNNTAPYASMPGQATYGYPYTAQRFPIAPCLAASSALGAGIFGLTVVGATVMGGNLRKVRESEMTMVQAVNNSLAKGVVGGVAAAAAQVVSRNLATGAFTGLVTTAATVAAVAYLLDKQ